MKGRAQRCEIQVSVAPPAARSCVGERNVHIGENSAQRELVLKSLLETGSVLPVRSFAKIPGALTRAVADPVCAEQADTERNPHRRLARNGSASPYLCIRGRHSNQCNDDE